MGYALVKRIEMTEMECGKCGVTFAMPETLRAECQEVGHTWYCPNGHPRVYRESDADRYKRLLNDATRKNTELVSEVTRAQIAEHRAETEARRLQKRIGRGVCTCCNRTFQNLARHMQTKHPETVTK